MACDVNNSCLLRFVTEFTGRPTHKQRPFVMNDMVARSRPTISPGIYEFDVSLYKKVSIKV